MHNHDWSGQLFLASVFCRLQRRSDIRDRKRSVGFCGKELAVLQSWDPVLLVYRLSADAFEIAVWLLLGHHYSSRTTLLANTRETQQCLNCHGYEAKESKKQKKGSLFHQKAHNNVQSISLCNSHLPLSQKSQKHGRTSVVFIVK